MTLFLIIGIIGLALVLVSATLGDFLDGMFEGLDGGGLLSAPVIGGFLAAFGFGAVLILVGTDASTGVAALGGLVAGIAVGLLALFMTKSVMEMRTDKTFKTGDLVGASGTVITRIPEGGLGEVSVSHAGQSLKLGARAEVAIAAGTTIVVKAETSSSTVVVEPLNH